MLKFVKTLVFLMMALIVVGLGALGYGLFGRSGSSGGAPEPGGFLPPPPEIERRIPVDRGPGHFGMLFLDEPEGTEIRSMAVSGNLLVLELIGGPQARPNRIVVLDLGTGEVRGRINLGSALH